MMVVKSRHDIVTRHVGDGIFTAECRTHAKGTPALAYRPLNMWIKAHLSIKCTCGHVAGSHGSLPVWMWHQRTEGLTSDGTACGTCQCGQYR